MSGDLKTHVRFEVLDAFTAPLKKLGLELKTVAGHSKKVGESFQLAAHLATATESLNKFAANSRRALAAPINEFVRFEHQMSKVAAVGDVTGENFARLKKQALDLGAATRYSAFEAAQAQESLVSAGLSVDAIMQVAPRTLEMATAGDLSLARSADILTGSLAAFGLEASEAARVTDVLAQGAAVSKADIEYLNQVVAKAGPLAKQLSMSLETTAAAGALFANAMIPAEVGGTALKTILLRISAPARDAQKAFASLHLGGKVLKDMQAELGKGNLPGVLQTIGKSFDKLGLSATQRLEKFKHLFGDEAAAQASVLITGAMQVDDTGFLKLQEAFRKSGGAAAKMAERMDNDTAGSLSRLSSSWEGFLTTLGGNLAPALTRISESIQPVLGRMGEWVEKNPELAAQLGHLALVTTATATGFAGAMQVVSAGSTAITASTKAYSGLRTAVLFLTPEIVSAKIAAWAAGPAFTKLSGSLIGKAGLVGAALMVGYGIGRLISNFFDLDKKISDFIANLTGINLNNREGDSDVGAGHDQVYGDGSVIDGKSGKVTKVGTGPAALAPKVVREAKAAGATSVDAVNAFAAQRAKPVAPSAAATADVAATKEQTRELARHLEEANLLHRQSLEEQRRNRTRPALGAGANPVGQ